VKKYSKWRWLVAAIAASGCGSACFAGNAFVTDYSRASNIKAASTRVRAETAERGLSAAQRATSEAQSAVTNMAAGAALADQEAANEAATNAIAKEKAAKAELAVAEAAADAAQADAEVVEDSKWVRFARGGNAGDAEVNFLSDTVEYKLNAVNYNLYLGDNLPIPFQLFFGDSASSDSPGETNQAMLLDPTQGFAMQFPIARKFQGDANSNGGFCQFAKRDGACIVGGDVTLRAVQLNEQTDAGEVKDSYVFGASASLKASLLFPIYKPLGDDLEGKLGIAVGARYYYHNTDSQDLLFGELTDPNGEPFDAKKGFGAWSAELEFDIFKYFKVRVEYFSPLNHRNALDDVFKASLVMAPK
jgi:hypothetical protein